MGKGIGQLVVPSQILGKKTVLWFFNKLAKMIGLSSSTEYWDTYHSSISWPHQSECIRI